MFFQVEFSPVSAASKPKKKVQKKESEEIAILSLALFTTTPKIFFEDVLIGNEAVRQLLIKNPTNQDIEINITRAPSEERNVSFSWSSCVVPACGECILEIHWHPTEEGGWRDTISLDDGRKIKKDVPCIFKSVRPKKTKPKSQVRKPLKNAQPVLKIVSKAKSPKKFPSPKQKKPTLKIIGRSALPNITNIPSILVDSPKSTKYSYKNKENCSRESYTISNKNKYLQENCTENYREDEMKENNRFRNKENNLQQTCTQSNLTRNVSTYSYENNYDKFSSSSKTSFATEKYFEYEERRDTYTLQADVFVKEFERRIPSSDLNLENMSTYDKRTGAYTLQKSCLAREFGRRTPSPELKFSDSLENRSPEESACRTFNTQKRCSSSRTESPYTPLNVGSRGHHVTFEDKVTEFRLQENTTAEFSSDIADQMQSTAFTFSPLSVTFTPRRSLNNFQPSVCSTEEKSKISNRTYEFGRESPDFQAQDLKNTSGDTYVLSRSAENKANLSSETYVKGNLSSDTYVKGNISNGTYTLDESVNSPKTSPVLSTVRRNIIPNRRPVIDPNSEGIKDQSQNFLSALQPFGERRNVPNRILGTNGPSWLEQAPQHLSSEGARSVIEADLWSGKDINTRGPLECIQEESTIIMSPAPNKFDSSISNHLKRKSEITSNVSPFKKEKLESVRKSPLKKPRKTWNKNVIPNTRALFKVPSLSLKEFIQKTVVEEKFSEENSIIQTKTVLKEEKSMVLHDPDKFLEGISNPLLLSCSNVDPFMTATMFYDPKWMDEQEIGFKKWLNALLTPPEELTSNIEGHPIDVAKLWQECKRKEVAAAPTKETVSNKYHINSRLQSLRTKSVALFRSNQVSQVLSKVCMMVENNKISIRADKNVHSDLGLQAEVMVLFLSYNPLWLRIGLETIYGITIPLHSNSDVMRLSQFIMNNFFKDDYLLKKHKIKYSPEYAGAMKKFILKKFLMFVFFLDYAKNLKLIAHDPCLFCKNAPIKESREILLKFSRDLLSAIGDVTKYLKPTGYIVTHKQTYIHEFDYAVSCLGVDLRDGVRLTKVMEFILLKENLTNGLRVPAISRLQKIHNVKIVFDALQDSGFEILYDITPKDIVDGHKEKTLSFLWQIIYKFQAPRLAKAATTIQMWWRSLQIVIKRRILDRQRKLREEAAIKIQHFYRRHVRSRLLSKFVVLLRQYQSYKRTERAVIKLQSFTRMYLERKRFLAIRKSVVLIQSVARKWIAIQHLHQRMYATVKIQAFIRGYLARKAFLKLKTATIYLQRLHRANRQMKQERLNYLMLQNSVITIQRCFRAKITGEKQRKRYLSLKQATIIIQRYYRAKRKMETQRTTFLIMKNSALTIQKMYRANKQMRIEREYYITLRKTTIKLQNIFRANQAMKRQQSKFNAVKESAICIQRKFRATKLMKIERSRYLMLRSAALLIQRRFRANKIAKLNLNEFVTMKQSVIKIQTVFRATMAMKLQRSKYLELKKATILIQRVYKAKRAMVTQRKQYLTLREAAVTIQRRFRAYRSMKVQLESYSLLKNTVVTIQRLYRAKLNMLEERNNYVKLKMTTIYIQRLFTAKLKMKCERTKYLMLKKAVLFTQMKFRAKLSMKKQQNEYLALREAAVFIQRLHRANQLMKLQSNHYCSLKKSAISIQRVYRANLLMKLEQGRYLELRKTVIYIQSLLRANLAMKRQRDNYLALKRATIITQRRFRANKLSENQRNEYLKLKKTVVTLQGLYKAKLEMRKQRQSYITLQKAAVTIQRLFRAKLAMKMEQSKYIALKEATLRVQRKYRAKLLMEKQKQEYDSLRRAVLLIQSRYRANRTMKLQRDEFLSLRKSVVLIQVLFKAKMAMVHERNKFLEFRRAVITCQRRYRAKRLMLMQRTNYLTYQKAAITIQRRFRAYKCMKLQRAEYEMLYKATVTMQRLYRANQDMKMHRQYYSALRKAATTIQTRFRAKLAMKVERARFVALKEAAMLIQTKYRAKLLMNLQRRQYLAKRSAAVILQRRFRAKQMMELHRKRYISLRNAVVFIQRLYKSNQKMTNERRYYLSLKTATVKIQTLFRAKQMKKITQSNYIILKNAAMFIQAKYRAKLLMKKQRTTYLASFQATIVIQRRYRALIMMKHQRSEYHCLRNAAVYIQRLHRATLAMKKERESFLRLRDAAVSTQRRFRAKKIMELQRNRYLALKKAAVVVQRRYRAVREMKMQRTSYLKYRNAVIMVQRTFRMLKARNETTQYVRMKKAVIYIENYYAAQKMMREQREEYLRLRSAALIVQRRFRGNKSMKAQKHAYDQMRTSAVIIQRWYRSVAITRREMLSYRQKISTIIKLQTFVRGYLIRMKYEDVLVKARQAVKVQKIKKESATKIQAYWRGYAVRRTTIPEVTRIRERTKIANSNARPENTLGSRRDQALMCLTSDNTTILQIIKALEDLEYVTRRDKETCLQMSELIGKQLYHMIGCATRSFPEMKASTVAASILLNFSKYRPASGNAWAPHHMNDVINVLNHCCDKETLLFPYLTTILWHYSHVEECKQFLLNLPQFNKRILKIKMMVFRMEKMVQRGANKGQSVFLSLTLPMPSRLPDWGIDYKDRPRAFTNSVHALKSLLNILDLA